MASLTRYLQKIFGDSVAASGNISKFGSYAAGSPDYSKDLDQIQTTRWLQAWAAATVGNSSPAIQDMNALFFALTYQLKYLTQKGIPEWIATETYYTPSYCTRNGTIYKSKTNDNIGNDPASDTNNWQTLASVILGSAGADSQLKAWVTFNGLTGGIYSAFNVSSVSRTATGCYVVNFATALANNLYGFSGSAGTPNGLSWSLGDDNSIVGGVEGRALVRTITQCSVFCWQSGGSKLEDSRCISVSFFGNSDPTGNTVFSSGGGGGGGGGGGIILP